MSAARLTFLIALSMLLGNAFSSTSIAGDKDEAPVVLEESDLLPAEFHRPFPRDLEPASLSEFVQEFSRLTGAPTHLDLDSLQDAGIGEDTEINGDVKGVPACVAIRRVLENVNGLRLGWFFSQDMFVVATEERCYEHLSTATLDIRGLRRRGFDFQMLETLIIECTSVPWEDHGGSPYVFGNALTIRQSPRGIREVRLLLKALEQTGRVVYVCDRVEGQPFDRLLEKRISVEFHQAPLAAAAKQISEQIGTDLALDGSALFDAGLEVDTPIDLTLRDAPLRAISRVPIEGVACGLILRNGRFLLTTREVAREESVVAVFPVPEITSPEEASALEQSLNQVPPSNEYHATICNVFPTGVVIVRTDMLGVLEVRKALEEIRRLRRLAEPEPVITNPERIEIRYYRLSEPVAQAVVGIIPRLIAPDSWESLESPDAVGDIEMVDPSGLRKLLVENAPCLPGGGFHKDPAQKGGPGFFQMQPGAAAAEEAPPAIADVVVAAPPPKDVVLVVRQTVKAQEDVETFLSELLYPGSRFRVKSWTSELPIETKRVGAVDARR